MHERIAGLSTSVVEGKFVVGWFVYVPVMLSAEINGAEVWDTDRSLTGNRKLTTMIRRYWWIIST